MCIDLFEYWFVWEVGMLLVGSGIGEYVGGNIGISN